MQQVEESENRCVQLKAQGNKAFAEGRYAEAIETFTIAIGLDNENKALFSNRAAAYVQLSSLLEGDERTDALNKAVADGDKCIELDAEWGKGYLRKGAALTMLEKHAEAMKAYAAGIAQDPTNKLLIDGLSGAQANLSGKRKSKKKKKKRRKAKDIAKDNVVIGIDLGTTNSCVGVWEDDKVVIIPNERGEKTTPSFVAFDPQTGKRYTGHAAKAQAARNPTNTIFDIKRVIGQTFDDEGVEQDARHFPYKIQKGPSNKPVVEVDLGMHGTKTFAPEELSSMVLTHMKKVAERYLGHDVKKAVITVPAYFNDSQRAATKAAGLIAGLEVLRIINEPTAAALSYGLDLKAKKDVKDDEKLNILVFDLGGGTFDVSILSIEGGLFEVLATGGDTRLGGEDFDQRILDLLVKEVGTQGFGAKAKDDRAVKRLKNAAEAAKRQLSELESAEIFIDSLEPADKQGQKGRDFKYTLSRDKFEKVNEALFLRCLETVKRVVKDAKLKLDEISEIVLVGGSTRIPKLQAMLSEFFNGKQLCRSVNPDEAVAYGAAVQGAVLSGTRSDSTNNLLLMDVTPLSLGIETTGSVMSVIIPRNTPIPCVKTQCYTTEENFQTRVDIGVYEGERMRTDHNNLLGNFTITGIEKAKRGEPKIDVSFSLDSDGILKVTAVDQNTNAKAAIEIQSKGRSSNEEIERMVREAEQFRAKDKEMTKRVEAQNELETTILRITEELNNMGMGGIEPSKTLSVVKGRKKEMKNTDDLAGDVKKLLVDAESYLEKLEGVDASNLPPATETRSKRKDLERRMAILEANL